MSAPTIASHFDGNEPVVQAVYDALLAGLSAYGEVNAVPKKTSIHLDNASGFAGVYTRKSYINLHFRLDYKLDDSRIVKVEQLSARRFKHTVRLDDTSDVDDQLMNWLKDAYELAS